MTCIYCNNKGIRTDNYNVHKTIAVCTAFYCSCCPKGRALTRLNPLNMQTVNMIGTLTINIKRNDPRLLSLLGKPKQ